MNIHTCVRDAKLMELAELQAIDNRARAVQANIEPNEQRIQETKVEEKTDTPQKPRPKKKKAGVRPN